MCPNFRYYSVVCRETEYNHEIPPSRDLDPEPSLNLEPTKPETKTVTYCSATFCPVTCYFVKVKAKL
jgi:hypothetical protein